MTDYRLKTEKTKNSDRKNNFFTKKKRVIVNETTSGLISKEQESDGLIKKSRDLTNKYRPDVTVKDPSTFAFFGSAKKYYEDAFDKIIGYYPYDGSKREILEWYDTASPVEVGLLQSHWPSHVGHINLSSSEYVSFYSGPQSISEFEYVGNYTRGETGLRLDAEKGNTVEFWLKKDGFSASEEVIFDIGSYPGKVSAGESGQFKLFLSNSSGSPFYASYQLKTVGAIDVNIGSSKLDKDSVADGNWHHYALKVYKDSGNLHMQLYVDGNFDSDTTSSVGSMSSVDTYMSGRIAAGMSDSNGSLSGSIDDFKFWKGKRTSKQIGRFFDQKVFASENLEDAYTTKLGLYYRFNKPSIGKESIDKLVLDYSGNDMTGIISGYSDKVRVQESAITNSPYTSTTELKDPCLLAESEKVKTFKSSLLTIGESYDTNNPSLLKNFVPEWVFDAGGKGLSNNESQISTLFHMMAGEFDDIRRHLNEIRKERTPSYEDTTQQIISHEDVSNLQTSSSYRTNNFFIGCDDEGQVFVPTRGSNSEFSMLKCEHAGIKVTQKPLINAEPIEEYDLKVDQITITKPFEEIRRSILENIYSSAKFILRRKGTSTSFESIMRSYGIDEDLISFNVYGNNTETFIEDSLLDSVSEEVNSVYFGQNKSSTIFLSSSESDERTYLQGDSEETEYTFEGTFIFPTKKETNHELTTSAIFGLSEVSATNNDLTAAGTNNADFIVKAVKDSNARDDAKFVLTSPSGIIPDIESNVFKDVYKNSRWNIALKVVKDLDNKFVAPSSAYKIELVGHNHILDVLQNSFTVTASLSQSDYEGFRDANKTLFIGAQRQNITGSVTTGTDIKAVNFNAWNDDLGLGELKTRSRSPSSTGRNKSHLYRDNYNTVNNLMDKNKILSIQFDAISDLTSNNDIVIADATSGSADNVVKYGALIGSKYPAKSTVFTSALSNVVQREFLPVVRNIPLGNLHGKDGIQIKTSEIEKFDLSSRPETKLFSFEKSMQKSFDREMVNFVGGLISFNNLIGEPVNKYRKNYKMLEHLRRKFFETVESENQFERFVSYFRWIDKSIGYFLEQLMPATAVSNTGIEDVVESHALERNKYDHKAPFVETKEYDSGLEANLLAINELLYDWEHGHAADDDNDHCLWQKDRKERTGDREVLRRVLTTKVEGSTYVTRNLVKPYKHTIDRQTLLNIGSNRNANKNRDLYKIINEGKEISILSDDIYEFKQCNDVLNPQEEKLYSAKTNTTTTDGYLDADADMILPFSLYSSSVGTDFENFKQNLKITNNHDGVPALQGPFVHGLVGGMPHRSVKIGTPGEDRPEAYDISSSVDSFVVKQTTGPKSMFHRDLAGARFYHIGNVKTTENPLIIGNYSKEYEIIMTNARSLNNNYLVENEGLNLTGGIDIGLYVPDITEFAVPQRPARDHVIVNRFAAPGGAESSTPQGMDRESSEYSVYNTVNYRNAIVRNIENMLSKEYSEQFGYRSGSTIQASRHMTNRNPRRFTGSFDQELIFDNNFVQHEIPQNDFGYSWVTASVNESVYSFLNKNENTGHQHLMNISGTLKSSQTIAFVSASEIGIGAFSSAPSFYGGEQSAFITGTFKPVDFVGLNTIVLEPLSADTNTLGTDQVFTGNSDDFLNNLINNDTIRPGLPVNSIRRTAGFFGDATTLNSVILNRQGPYGWPSWKQIRGEQHPITRNHKKNNKLSVVYREVSGKKYTFVDSIKGDYVFDFKETVDISDANTSARLVKNYDEMFVTSKFNPLNVNLTRYNALNVNIENLNIAIRAAIGIPLVGVNQMSQHHMWTNDEYYLSAIQRDASRIASGVSLDEEDKFSLFGINGVFSEEQQDMLSDALGGLRESTAVSMRASVQNTITGFAQRKLENLIITQVENSDIWSKYIDEDKYASHTGLSILKNFLSQPGRGTMRELNYIETVYPREINTYKSSIRGRQSFDFFGWNSTRSNRELILSGNVRYFSPLVAHSTNANLHAFIPTKYNEFEKEFKKSYYNRIDIVDVNSTGSDISIASSTHITSSKWVLDSRETFGSLPVNISNSFFNNGNSFLSSRDQGTRGAGTLQNDYSIFPLGYNGLRGAPPLSPLYNRRIPQRISQARDITPARYDLSNASEQATLFATSASPQYEPFKKLENGTIQNTSFDLGTIAAAKIGGGNIVIAYTELSTEDMLGLGTSSFPMPETTSSTPDSNIILEHSSDDPLTDISPLATNENLYLSFTGLGLNINEPNDFHCTSTGDKFDSSGGSSWGDSTGRLETRIYRGGTAFIYRWNSSSQSSYQLLAEYSVPEFHLFIDWDKSFASEPNHTTAHAKMTLVQDHTTGSALHPFSAEPMLFLTSSTTTLATSLQPSAVYTASTGSINFLQPVADLGELLAGEAKWEAADHRTGPFYDTYEEYAEGLRNVGQTYSLIPEFRMHRVIEDYLKSADASKLAIDEFLELTGAVYHTSSGNLSVGTQFFETYSMSDFMKYFQVVQDDLEKDSMGLAPGKLTLRCQAVKRFLPYRGFYPAERVVQISELFDRGYLHASTRNIEYLENDSISRQDATSYLQMRIDNSKAQAIKPLFAPGVLLNSIKTGLAVDYPIFSSSVSNGVDHIFDNFITSSLNDFSSLSLGSTAGFTGSLVNSSEDEGIPRIDGPLEYRIDFDDLIAPRRLFNLTIYDNEPHPSASTMYGMADHLKVLDRPALFGNVDQQATKRYGAMGLETTGQALARGLLPYTLATQNFCAETVNFFLEDGVLSTAISSPGSQYFDNSTYKMRVYIANENTVMYDRHSAFGPPVDEGDLQVTRYELRDTTVQAAKASGSIQFDKFNTEFGDYLGKTITVPIDQTPSNSTTYEFVTDVTSSFATASIDFSGISDPHGSLSGSTITLEDSSGTETTFIFKTDIAAATASAPLQFAITPVARVMPAREFQADWPTGESASLDGLRVDLDFDSYQFTGSSNTVCSVFFYNSESLKSDVLQMKFGSPVSYQNNTVGTAIQGDNPGVTDHENNGLPKLILSSTISGSHNFYFYNSNLYNITGQDLTSFNNEDRTFIDLFNTAQSRFKHEDEVAETFANRINDSTVPILSGAFIAAFNTASNGSFVGGVNIYSKQPGDGNGTQLSASVGFFSNAFAELDSISKVVARISTGSSTYPNFHGSLVDRRTITTNRQTWQSGIDLFLVGAESPHATSRFVEVTASATSDDVALNFMAAINDLPSERNVTASFGSSVGGQRLITIHRTDPGSQGNTDVGYTPTQLDAFSSPDLLGTAVRNSPTDARFTGGADGETFTNTAAEGSNFIIKVGVGATTNNVAASGNVAFSQRCANISTARVNSLVSLTQSIRGASGNTTIGQTGFVADGGSINGGSNSQFGGGVDAASRTTGQAIGGGNNNIAVVVGVKNSGGVSGSFAYEDILTVSSRMKDAITTNQGSTFDVVNNDDGDNGSRTIAITHKTAGIFGNAEITCNDSGEDVFSASDILGLTGGLDHVQGTIDYVPINAIQSSSHGYLPYVAPFLDPNTTPFAELSFTPSTDGEYSIPEILNDLQITYYNMPAPSNASQNLNYKQAMVLSASLNLKARIKLRGDHTTELIGGKSSIDPNSVELTRWVIRPKWETPVIDFSDVTSSAVNLNNNSVQQVSGSPWKNRYQSNYYEVLKDSDIPYLTASTGMWHQSGNLIDEMSEKGYFMVIEAGDARNTDKYAAKDLATKVGFLDGSEDSRKIRLGQVATDKKVWEAVVAIPFYNDPKLGIKFFDLDPDSTRAAARINYDTLLHHTRRMSDNSLDSTSRSIFKAMYDNFYNNPGTDGPENIAYQMRMMEKFIIPPQFDFLLKDPQCADARPFVQYIFQFCGKLTDEDLASMWQNLYPNSQSGFATGLHSSPYPNSGIPNAMSMDYPDIEYVSNFLDTESVGMFQAFRTNYENVSEFLHNEVRWLVFKAKQRGISQYNELVYNSITNHNIHNLLEIDGRSVSMTDINKMKKAPQFNWPYDYFSLVELGKIETKVDFYDNIRTVGVPKESPPRGDKYSQTTNVNTSYQMDDDSPSGQGLQTQVGVVNLPSQATSNSITSVADSMVFREALLVDTDTPSTRIFNVSGGTVSAGTEQLFVNGVLQSLGGSNDYTISGNTVTFTYDLQAGDSVVISYVKD